MNNLIESQVPNPSYKEVVIIKDNLDLKKDQKFLLLSESPCMNLLKKDFYILGSMESSKTYNAPEDCFKILN